MIWYRYSSPFVSSSNDLKRERAFRVLVILAVGLTALLLLAAGGVYWVFHASLAQLEGRCILPGLSHTVGVERDALGVPLITASNRLDATRALGFLHAQERFFQMDLSRRAGAGEFSELFGSRALSRDRQQRLHRPRTRARAALAAMPAADAALLVAYAEGINAGLRALRVRPPEYLLLRCAPASWQPEDTFLVGYAMFDDLHDIVGFNDYREAVLRKALPDSARRFFDSPDVTWSAAIDGSTIPAPPIPPAEEFSFSAETAQTESIPPRVYPTLSSSDFGTSEEEEAGMLGSNNWAVDGARSTNGAAIVANDMHLGLRVPNTWFRVRLVYGDDRGQTHDVTGVTLPGAPVVVSGSNRHVAWANTASYLDVSDLVELEFHPSNPRQYRVADGWKELQSFDEVVRVRGASNVLETVDETIWGPIITWGGERYALACTMHQPDAINMGLVRVEQTRAVEEVLAAAAASGTPVNNFVVGDRSGKIGYSLLGRLPARVNFDGVKPVSWADGTRGWRGWLPAASYPVVLNPANGFLWTANNRVLGSSAYQALNISRPDNGCRAGLIRADLAGENRATEHSLWRIYGNDQGAFFDFWQKLLRHVLERDRSGNTNWTLAREFVRDWGGRAAENSHGYLLVRRFRSAVIERLFSPLNERLARFSSQVRISSEDAALAMLKLQPVHLLNPRFVSFEALLEEAAEHTLAEVTSGGRTLWNATWGSRNRLDITHPLAGAVPALSRWLDMPNVPVSGDHYMPKVHSPGQGVSQRMIVSPGHEESGLYNMPGGQSGHFLSPFYRSEMENWLKLTPMPFLPGRPAYRLQLTPSDS